MKSLVIVFFCIFAFSSPVFSYPQEQFTECVLSAKSNPSILGAPEQSIENFCDCALKSIMDEGLDPDSSANQCVRKYFR